MGIYLFNTYITLLQHSFAASFSIVSKVKNSTIWILCGKFCRRCTTLKIPSDPLISQQTITMIANAYQQLRAKCFPCCSRMSVPFRETNERIGEYECFIDMYWVIIPGGGTHDIFGRGCATIKSLYRPFLEFLKKKLDPFRNFCA